MTQPEFDLLIECALVLQFIAAPDGQRRIQCKLNALQPNDPIEAAPPSTAADEVEAANMAALHKLVDDLADAAYTYGECAGDDNIDVIREEFQAARKQLHAALDAIRAKK